MTMTITMNQMRTARNKGIQASIFESEKFIADPGGAVCPCPEERETNGKDGNDSGGAPGVYKVPSGECDRPGDGIGG